MTRSRAVLLIEDGSGVTALAAARSLAASGWSVAVGCPDGRSPATVSRSCHVSGPVRPLTRDTAQGWLADVQSLARRTNALVVVPCGDAELLTLSAARARLSPLLLPYPADDVVQQLLDKQLLTELARSAGLRSPRTELAEPGVPPAFDGPVVVKPRWHGPVQTRSRVEAVVAHGPADAIERAALVRRAGAQPVYQQHVEGSLVAHIVVRSRQGVTLARLHQRAHRTYPLPAGSCVRGVTEEPPAGLMPRVDRLLDSLGWWGLVQLELLEDAGGELHLVDANPRPYGTMALANAAGIALCHLWIAEALGDRPAPPLPPLPPPRPAAYQALGLDLRRAVAERRPTLLADVGSTVGLWKSRPTRPVWRASDPAPFWLLTRRVAARAFKRLWQRSPEPLSQDRAGPELR